MKYNNEATYNENGKNIVFKFNSNPSLLDILNAIENITDGVINETNGYEPFLFDYYVTVVFISTFTDINLPENINDIYSFICSTKIDSVLQKTVPDLWNKIVSAADEKIKYRRNVFLKKTKFDELIDALVVLINKYGSVFDGIDINDVLDKLTSISKLTNIPETKIVEGILDYHKENNLNLSTDKNY